MIKPASRTFWLTVAGLLALMWVPQTQAQQSPTPNAAQPAADTQPPATAPVENQGNADPLAEENAAESSEADTAGSGDDPATTPKPDAWEVWSPLVILGIGILIVLGLIVGFKVNAFIALITAAIAVSLMAPGDISDKIGRVASAFGSTAGGIGIVIALAAVIGKCMLDSGAADRIVRAFVNLLGEKRAPIALMGSGYVLSVPVFFDTVFYLLVPLARSLHRRTGVQYLKYIMAIAAGGALTHSLVPPTPGPLLMASTLNVDLGLMILIGALVAMPAAFVGVIYSHFCDRIMKTPMRPISGIKEPEPLREDQLPSLGMALLPVLLPVLMISANTICTTVADMEPTTEIKAESIQDWSGLQQSLVVYDGPDARPGAARIWDLLPANVQSAIAVGGALDAEQQEATAKALNSLLRRKDLYNDEAFLGVKLRKETKGLISKDTTRMRRAVLEHRHRMLLEDVFNTPDRTILAPHVWATTSRKVANISDLFGNANLALLLSTVIAMWMLMRQRSMTLREMADVVEQSLMSGGVIILITSGGGAFGGMLKAANISDSIETLFGGVLQDGGQGGMVYLFLGFMIAAVLKVAQGSGTVAMIVGSSMMAAIIGGVELGYSPVYLATAVGAGSLVGSWMNDSGFWIFAKMGGLTETEALKSWTSLLVVLGIVSFAVTLALAAYLPLAPTSS